MQARGSSRSQHPSGKGIGPARDVLQPGTGKAPTNRVCTSAFVQVGAAGHMKRVPPHLVLHTGRRTLLPGDWSSRLSGLLRIGILGRHVFSALSSYHFHAPRIRAHMQHTHTNPPTHTDTHTDTHRHTHTHRDTHRDTHRNTHRGHTHTHTHLLTSHAVGCCLC